MRSELPPELSLGKPGGSSGDDPGGATDGDPEVRVERPDVTDASGSTDGLVAGDRVVLLACAVLGALALLVVAWSSWRSADAAQEQACLDRAQIRAFASDNIDTDGREEMRQALAECGFEPSGGDDEPDADDDGGGSRRD